MKVFCTTFTTVVLNSVFFPLANTAIAQVTPDGTTSTTVKATETGVQIDEGGQPSAGAKRPRWRKFIS